MKSLFAGYTNAPVYSVGVVSGEGINAELNGSQLVVTAIKNNSLNDVTIDVLDADGSKYQRNVYVAVTSDENAQTSIDDMDFIDEDSMCVISNLDGKLVAEGRNLETLASKLPSGIYAVKAGNKKAKVIVR